MIKRYTLLAIILLSISDDFVLAQNRAFPQAVSYTHCIKPNNVTQAAMNASVAGYYDYWKSKYLKNNLSSLPGGYYVKGDITGHVDGYTPVGSSDGQGYGMIITVLMAGYDKDARTIFDGLFKTARAYHSIVNSHLMGWVIADRTDAQGHFDSSTDGDMDIAYSLILAHYQWGSNGPVNYLNEAKKIITNGLKVANVTDNNRLNLGDWDKGKGVSSRSSDWMPGHMRAFYQETNDVAWLNVINNLYEVYTRFSNTYSPTTGLISDFVVKKIAEPAPANFLGESAETNEYSYNACRLPLRIAMDYALYGSAGAYAVSTKMVNWIKQQSGGNPANIKDGYQLNGNTSGSATVAVFVAPFVAASVVSSNNQDFLNKGWEYLKSSKSGYYSDSYSLLCQLFISGNWWKPEISRQDKPVPVDSNLVTASRSVLLEKDTIVKQKIIADRMTITYKTGNKVQEGLPEISVYPVPFDNNVTITFSLKAAGPSTLKVYDINGKQVAVIISGQLQQGTHTKIFAADNLPAGIYFLELRSNNKVSTRKLIKR